MLDDDGEKSLFEEIYFKHKEMMGRVAAAILKNEDAAIDAVHNAFVAIAKNIKTFPRTDDEEYERRYVAKVVRNASINELNKLKRQPEVVSLEDFYSLCGDKEFEPISDDRVAVIVSLIEQMPLTYRDALSLKYLYGMSVKEIAVSLNKPFTTVHSQIVRGTGVLRAKIKELYGDDL